MLYHGYEADFDEVVGRFDFSGLYTKKILVTGATGMIGACLVDFFIYLNQNKSANIKIKILARSSNGVLETFGLNADYIEVVEGDIRSVDTSRFGDDLDYIVNAASIANPAAYISNPVETIDTSILGVRSLLDYAKSSKLERIIHLSTVEVTGVVRGGIVSEDTIGGVDIMNTRASYPESKRLSEVYCRSYNSQYGTDVVIARPVKTYGLYNNKSDNRAMAYMQRCMEASTNIRLGTKAQSRYALCYAVDVVTAILTLLLHAKSGETYNIADGASYASISDIAEELAKRVGLSVEYETLEDSKFSQIASDMRYDSSKLESLGWYPLTSLADGMDKIVRFVR
ncbi:NAD(P)-dependent oxidoreductase [Candidatus Saccharibacteria bacterium TM7i]|nr:NAD(P)-dependent oxidoreductase [Candidatus Saccharibacteria bacterium TM7i]